MWESYLDDIEGLVYMIDVGRENIEDSIKVLSKFFYKISTNFNLILLQTF